MVLRGIWHVVWACAGWASFCHLLLIAYGLIFNSVQANSVSRALTFAFDIPPYSGIALATVSLLVIVGGIKGVARLMQWFVPMMALLWVGSSIIICLWHIGQLPDIIVTIIKAPLAGRKQRRCGRIYAKPGHCQRFSARHVF